MGSNNNMKNLIKLTQKLYQKIKNNPKIYRYDSPYAIKSNFDWGIISSRYELPEDFIKEFMDYVYWSYISQFQKLSFEFIIEFIKKFEIEYLKYNDKIKLTEVQWIVIKNLKILSKN